MKITRRAKSLSHFDLWVAQSLCLTIIVYHCNRSSTIYPVIPEVTMLCLQFFRLKSVPISAPHDSQKISGHVMRLRTRRIPRTTRTTSFNHYQHHPDHFQHTNSILFHHYPQLPNLSDRKWPPTMQCAHLLRGVCHCESLLPTNDLLTCTNLRPHQPCRCRVGARTISCSPCQVPDERHSPGHDSCEAHELSPHASPHASPHRPRVVDGPYT